MGNEPVSTDACQFCGAESEETFAMHAGSAFQRRACLTRMPACKGTRTKMLRRLLAPRETLAPGECNVLVLVKKDGGKQDMRVVNRFVRGMSKDVVVPLQSFKSGIYWDNEQCVAIHTVAENGQTAAVDLCKLIITNRPVFGQSYADCPVRPCPSAYTTEGIRYWDRVLQASYVQADNARRDSLFVAEEPPAQPISRPSCEAS